MHEKLLILFSFVKASAYLSPLLFILFHLMRQFLFIPVAIVCMAGGMLYGSVLGMLYSTIGLMIVCCLFYRTVTKWPRLSRRLSDLKQKWFGKYASFTVGQVAILRLIPFFHYQMLNFCLYEKHPTFRSYFKATFLSNLPLIFFYTVFGQFISSFSPKMIVLILMALALLFYTLREKIKVMKWKEFFREHSH